MNKLLLAAFGLAFAIGSLAQEPAKEPRPVAAKADGLLDLNRLWSRGKAQGKGPVRFTHAPMRLDDIERLIPYGLMVGGHVLPIDHQYYYPSGQKPCDVLAPADGTRR